MIEALIAAGSETGHLTFPFFIASFSLKSMYCIAVHIVAGYISFCGELCAAHRSMASMTYITARSDLHAPVPNVSRQRRILSLVGKASNESQSFEAAPARWAIRANL